MYDIVIIGAGPAGATLARLLDTRFKVMLIDKRDFNHAHGGFKKCCGGLLAPDAQKMLAHLGLGIPKETLVGPQLFSVKTLDYDNVIEKHYQRHYINIHREKFDQWMVDLVPKHVTKVFGARYKSFTRQQDGSYGVYFHKEGKKYKVNTKWIIGADGGFSTVREQIGLGQDLDEYASIQEWYHVDNPMPYFTTIFDREVTDYYSWTIPKENGLIVGAAIPKGKSINESFNRLKEKLIDDGFKLNQRIKREGAYIIRPRKFSKLCYGKGNVFLLGEAAGFISPSSSEGFSYGMKSGMILATVLNQEGDKLDIRHYKKACRTLALNIMIKNMKIPFMYNPFIRKLVMKSGILSMKTRQ